MARRTGLRSRCRTGWLAALAVAMPVALATPTPGVAAVVAAPAWTVDMKSSRLRFQSSFGGASFTGAFGRWSADIRFDPRNLPGSAVLVRIDMKSAKTGSDDRDQALVGTDWFATARFGQAVFAAKTFKDLGGGRYQAVGTLTLRGVTRPLILPFLLKIEGKQARVMGSTALNRQLFGVGQGQFATAETIPFDVQVSIALAATRP